MASCVHPGSTNPDISGLGTIIAFSAQAGISVILSIVALFMDGPEYRKAQRLTRNARRHAVEPMKNRNKDLIFEIIKDILITASDGQTFNGIALLVAGLIQRSTLGVYHFRIIYESASFTGVSFCAALAIVFQSRKERRISRYFAIAIFTVLYLAFIILFGNELVKWDWDRPGGCYNTSKTAENSARHPYVDRIYLGITALYMYLVLVTAASTGSGLAFYPVPEYQSTNIAAIAMLQYPLHLYSIIALRISNAPLLEGDSENSWGFGQIVALVTVFATLLECVRGIRKYLQKRNTLPLENAEEPSVGNTGGELEEVRCNTNADNSGDETAEP